MLDFQVDRFHSCHSIQHQNMYRRYGEGKRRQQSQICIWKYKDTREKSTSNQASISTILTVSIKNLKSWIFLFAGSYLNHLFLHRGYQCDRIWCCEAFETRSGVTSDQTSKEKVPAAVSVSAISTVSKGVTRVIARAGSFPWRFSLSWLDSNGSSDKILVIHRIGSSFCVLWIFIGHECESYTVWCTWWSHK